MANIREITDALVEDAGKLDYNPQESQVFIKALQLLSKGEPLNSKQLAQIAKENGLSEDEANEALNWVAEKNKDGNIAGLAGLSVNQWSHKFKVNGSNLTTWCALDTLYLPQILNQTVAVESQDPGTKQTVHLSLGPKGVEKFAPSNAVISIVIPKTDKKGLESAEAIWKAFCHFSLYFTSVESGKKWFEGRGLDPIFLSPQEGHELGSLWFEDVIKYV